MSEKKTETEQVFNHLVVFRSYRIFMDMFIFLCFGLSIPPVKLLYSLSYQNTSYPLITQSSLSLSVLPRLYMHKQTRFEPLVPVYLSLLSLSFSVSVTCCPTDTHSHTLRIHMHNCPLKGKPFSRGCQFDPAACLGQLTPDIL